jgi:hypothetical protein
MPYIDGSANNRINLEPESERDAMTAGELTFQLTSLCDRYLLNGEGLNFQSIAEAVAALECTKLELYRRLAAPYEDQKIQINGDVFLTKVKPIGKVSA